MSHGIELLAPAGNLEKLKTVLRYGADAAYLGGKAFNLRAGSANFSMESLREGVEYAHSLGKRVYVTLNIIAHNRDVKGLPNFIKFLEEVKVDAVIVADIGIMSLVREYSNLPIHVSTQASTANWMTAKTFHQMGAKRVVLARELGLDEIKAIKTSEYPVPAPRPANSRLDTSKIKETFMLTLPSWQEEVSKVLQMLIDSNGVEKNGTKS